MIAETNAVAFKFLADLKVFPSRLLRDFSRSLEHRDKLLHCFVYLVIRIERNWLRFSKRSLKIGKVFGRQGKLIRDYRRTQRSGSDEIDEETLQRRHYLRNARTTVRTTESVYRLMTLPSGPG